MKLPIYIDMNLKKVLIVGGGMKAYHKAKVFSESGAKVTVVSKAFCTRLNDLEGVNLISEILDRKTLNTAYFDQAHLVVIATSNNYLNQAISRYCKENHRLYTTSDPAIYDDFTIMSQGAKEGLTLAAIAKGTNSTFEEEIITSLLENMDEALLTRLSMMAEEKRLLGKVT